MHGSSVPAASCAIAATWRQPVHTFAQLDNASMGNTGKFSAVRRVVGSFLWPVLGDARRDLGAELVCGLVTQFEVRLLVITQLCVSARDYLSLAKLYTM